MRRVSNFNARMLLASFAFAASTAMAEPIEIPGTKVALEAPDGFVLATQFSGLVNEELVSSIVISELPAPYDAMAEGFTKEAMAGQNMNLLASEEVEISGRPGRLLYVTQVVGGAVYEKRMAVTGNDVATLMLVATYPQAIAARMRAPMHASLLSATWQADAAVDRFEGLPFRIRETEHLKIRNRVQHTLLLAPPQRTTAASASEPFAIVGSSHSPVRIDDVELFARQRITQTAKISDLREIRGEGRRVDGRPAYEITAKARDLDTGAPLAVYQFVVVAGETYYLIQGMVGETLSKPYLAEFRQLAASLEIR